MMIDDFSMVLCDPVTHDPLESFSEPGRNGMLQEQLLNSTTGKGYPVREGIPYFLEDSGVSGSNRAFQTMYDRLARFYDIPYLLGYTFSRRKFLQNIYDAWRGEIEVRENDRILEVSIGTGFNRRYFPRNISYWGLDISPGMLKQCQRNLKKWDLDAVLVRGQAELLPFRDDTFDIVFHCGGINFFNDKARAIDEMIRVAKPGAKIVIIDENEKFMKFYNAIPTLKKVTKNRSGPIVPPTDLVPTEMLDVKCENKWKERFYCISFTKPR